MIYDEDEIQRIIKLWTIDGYNVIDGTGAIPVHPEFIYRLSGEWVGWNNFFEIEQTDEEYIINFERDLLENIAFQKMCH